MLYRKLIHPQLLKREDEIDRCLGKVKNAGYDMVYSLVSRWFEYATNLIMTAAVKVEYILYEFIGMPGFRFWCADLFAFDLTSFFFDWNFM